MFNVLQFVMKSQPKRSGLAQKTPGFTLIELLVGLVLAFLILVPLMDFLIGTLNSDRREQAKVTSEQEIQSAIDYITHDLEEAVYIYDADGLTKTNSTNPSSSGIQDQIPPFRKSTGCSDPATCKPILVFWKRALQKNVVPVNATSNCTATPSSCNDTFVYSLVGYYLITDHTDKTWSQAARIGRFEVKDGVKDPNNTGQYLQAPTTLGFQPFDLQTLSGNSLKQKMDQWQGPTSYNDPTLVLVDYIDQSPFKSNDPTKSAPATDICGATQTAPSPKPPRLVTGQANGFYACVIAEADTSTLTPTVGNSPLAQVIMFGNALARIQNDNINSSSTTKSFFPKITALVRGRGFQNFQ